MPKLTFKGDERLSVYRGIAEDGSKIKVAAGESFETDAPTAKRLLKDFPKLFKKTAEKKAIEKPPEDRAIKSSTKK